MKKIQVLGTGRPACPNLAAMPSQAATELNIAFELEKVGEIDRILAFDIATTPALVVDGAVKVSGRVPSLDELKDMIR